MNVQFVELSKSEESCKHHSDKEIAHCQNPRSTLVLLPNHCSTPPHR